MIVKTPSGYVVELKDKLTFGEMRLLQKELLAGMKAEPDKPFEIDLARLIEYGEKAFPLLVISVTKNGEKLVTGLYAEVDSWDSADGQAVYNAINEIIKSDDPKKKS